MMRFSVVIANYNYGHLLPAAIDSVLAQSVAADEIIVVDDGSTDHSRAVIAGYGGRIRAIFQDNAGQAAAISRGFAAATGDIVSLLDADDVFHPEKIARLKRLYDSEPAAQWIFHDLHQFAPDGTAVTTISANPPWRAIDERAAMTTGRLGYQAPATSGLTFRRAFITPIFPLPTAESIYVSDHYIKFFALATGTGLHVEAALAGQLIHGENLYTGKKNQIATRAKIFINTAYFLAAVAPQILPFTDRLLETGMASSVRAGLFLPLWPRIKSYLVQRPFKSRCRILMAGIAKTLLEK